MVQALEEVGQREKAVQEDLSVGKKNEKDDNNINDEDTNSEEVGSGHESDDDISDEDSESDNDNNGILSSLTKGDLACAFFVVMISSSLAYYFGGSYLSNNTSGSTYFEQREAIKNASTSPYGPSYKRTWGIQFCLPSRLQDLPAESGYRNKPLFCSSSLLLNTGSKDNEDKTERRQHWNDPQMKLVNFSVPREYVPSLLSFFEEDYPLSYKSLHMDPAVVYANNPIPFYTQGSSSEEIPVKVYVDPSVDKFYKNEDARQLIMWNQQEQKKKEAANEGDIFRLPASSDVIEAVEPSFKGFALKVINLSHKPVDMWWDGGYEHDSEGSSVKRNMKIATILPFEAVGTATFPGHQFFISPTYDSTDAIDRFVATPEDAIHVFDPFENPPLGSGVTTYRLDRLPNAQRRHYEKQKLNVLYSRFYQVHTRRPWYGMFPRPPPIYHMWSADYFGQTHTIQTNEKYYQKIPPQKMLKPMTMLDMEQRPSDHQLFYRSGNEEMLALNLTVISCRPRVFEIKNFLSTAEANYLLSLAREGGLEQSTVSAVSSGESFEKMRHSSARSSSNAWIHRERSPIVDTIYRRAADVMKIDESYMRDRLFNGNNVDPLLSSRAEALQLIHYDVGQHYAPHHDFTFPTALNPYQPTRFATLLLYLNDEGLEGGETGFPRGINAESSSGLMISPEIGKAVLFYNMLPDGNMDDLSQHAALPVRNGEKWLANLWVWDAVNAV
jgi:prolyl 4-hydroxylase